MKKFHLVLAGLCASTLLAPAHSAPYLYKYLATWPEFSPGSSDKVSIYGTVDVGLNYLQTENGHSLFNMQSGGNYTSKLGFYGREDLGGGLRAEFTLESSIKADTGAGATPFFDRGAWVGLKSNTWGTVRLGNQLGATLPLFVDVFGLVTTNSMNYWLASAVVQKSAYTSGITSVGLNSDLGNGATQVSTRVPRAISYQTLRYGGFDLKAMYAPGASTETSTKVYNQGLVTTYINGPWFASASYNQVWGNNATTLQEVRTDVTGIASIYDTGSLVLSAAVNQVAVKIADGGTATVYSLGFILPKGRHVMRISLVYRDTDGVRNTATKKEVSSSALGLMAGYDHEFSKNVGLYGRFGILRNHGASTIILNNASLPLQSGSSNAQLGVESRTASVGMYYHF